MHCVFEKKINGNLSIIINGQFHTWNPTNRAIKNIVNVSSEAYNIEFDSCTSFSENVPGLNNVNPGFAIFATPNSYQPGCGLFKFVIFYDAYTGQILKYVTLDSQIPFPLRLSIDYIRGYAIVADSYSKNIQVFDLVNNQRFIQNMPNARFQYQAQGYVMANDVKNGMVTFNVKQNMNSIYEQVITYNYQTKKFVDNHYIPGGVSMHAFAYLN